MDNISSVVLIKQSDYKSMAWKNGFGFTYQIDIQPPGSPFPSDSFSWRLSTAKVSGGCTTAFSLFPDCDRILVVWKGDGLCLNNKILLEPFKPHTFSGEEPITCDIIGEQDVIDFGIIFRRDLVNATMNIHSFQVKACQGVMHVNHLKLEKGTHYLTCIKGCFTVGGTTGVNSNDTVILNVKEEAQDDAVVSIDSSEDIRFFHVHVSHKVK